MVLSNLAKNFSNTFKSRPPLVVFTVCLLGIIVTTFSLAYYVHGHDKIINSDAKTDWLSLVKYLNRFDVCIENATGVNDEPEIKNSVNIAVLARISPSITNNRAMLVRGAIPMDGWSSKCPDKTEVPLLLQVSFGLPLGQNNTKIEEVCVLLTGPADFMPKLSDQELCEPILNKNFKPGKLSFKSTDSQEPKGFCSTGALGKLEYDIDYNKNLKFDMFLSLEDRLTINSHLIVTSSFLVFIVILITCYALFNKRNTNASDSKQLLMNKGMYI